MTNAHLARVPRRLAAFGVALACAVGLGVGAPAPTPAQAAAPAAASAVPAHQAAQPQQARAARAARVGKAGAVWMTHQFPSAGTVGLRLEWAKVRGARYYEIEYAPGRGRITREEVKSSRAKKVKRVRGRARSTQSATITGLAPGKVYCFQVRGRRGKTSGYRGAVHCKVTTEAARVRPAAYTEMVVGTFNTCSAACDGTLARWSPTRRDLVLQRIRQMNVGTSGRDVDVLSIQEGHAAIPDLERGLAGTFTKACDTDSPADRKRPLDAVFVRDATYAVVSGTAGSMRFTADKGYGACWVKVRAKETGEEFVVVGLHLDTGQAASDDRVRAGEIDRLVKAVTAAHPDERIVYAGDFNSTRSRGTDAPLLRLHATGHDDAYDQSVVYRSKPYRNSTSGTTGAVRESWTWGDHVDRVFAPPGAHVASWEVDYRLRSTRQYDTPLASDHNPVLVHLLLPRAP